MSGQSPEQIGIPEEKSKNPVKWVLGNGAGIVSRIRKWHEYRHIIGVSKRYEDDLFKHLSDFTI